MDFRKGHEEKDGYGIEAHGAVMPLYCLSCGKSQPKMYVISGSHYGVIGETKCKFCNQWIGVSDLDGPPAFVFLSRKGERVRIEFQELYLMHGKYIREMGVRFGFDAYRLLKERNSRLIEVNKYDRVVEEILEEDYDMIRGLDY